MIELLNQSTCSLECGLRLAQEVVLGGGLDPPSYSTPFSLGHQVQHRQAPASTECCRLCSQLHAEVWPRTHLSPAWWAALAGRSSVGAVQAVYNGPSMSAAQSTTVHDCCIHTSDIARRQHLWSAGCHQLFVPWHWRLMFGHRPFL